MSVIATSTGIDNDEELNLNSRVWDEIRKKGFEHLDEVDEHSDDSDENDEDGDDEGSEDEDEDDFEIDEKALAVEKMAKQMEDNIADQLDYASKIDRRLARSELKKKHLIEQQRLLKEDVSDDEALDNQDLMDVDSEGDDESSDPEPEPLKELQEGKDNESEGHTSSDDDKIAFVNPLSQKKRLLIKRVKSQRVNGLMTINQT